MNESTRALHDFINSDATAASFQNLGQYRTALKALVNESRCAEFNGGHILEAISVSALTIFLDGHKEMTEAGCNGFEYKIGEIAGGDVMITYAERDAPVVETVGGGFGYTLLFEGNKVST